MAYDPSDLRLPPWICWCLDALIRLRIPFAPRWHIGMTRAGALMFFSLLGLWSAALYSGNNLLYLCGGMLTSIACMAGFQGIQILRNLPMLGSALPDILEANTPYMLRKNIPTSSHASAMIEARWLSTAKPLHLHINMQSQHMTVMAKLHSSERANIALSKQCLSTSAPLGLWEISHQRCDPALFLVLPTPIPWTYTQTLGEHAISQRIEGDEYDDLRAYVAGDSLARIHWRKSTLEPSTWRIKRFSQAQQTKQSRHLRVDLRCPKHASPHDFERLLGMAWYALKSLGDEHDIVFILGQKRFQLAQPKAYQAALQALAQAEVETMPPLAGKGMLLAL